MLPFNFALSYRILSVEYTENRHAAVVQYSLKAFGADDYVNLNALVLFTGEG
jgi:hypothetical protein